MGKSDRETAKAAGRDGSGSGLVASTGLQKQIPT